MYVIENDEESEVVATSIEALEELLKSVGPILLENHLEAYTKLIQKALQGQLNCQLL